MIDIGTEAFGELVSWMETSLAVARVSIFPPTRSRSARIAATSATWSIFEFPIAPTMALRIACPSPSLSIAVSTAVAIAVRSHTVSEYPVLSSTSFATEWRFTPVNVS